MNTPIRILGIGGSLRRGSYNRAAVRAAIELAPKGATVETFELDDIPPFNQDEEQNPPGKVTELKRRIRDADAILFVTPEYNWSVSGVLKNATACLTGAGPWCGTGASHPPNNSTRARGDSLFTVVSTVCEILGAKPRNFCATWRESEDISSARFFLLDP